MKSETYEEDRLVAAEANRIKEEYARRAAELSADLYAPWQPAELLSRSIRVKAAATILRRCGSFPAPGDQCLEVGFGRLGWLSELIAWGVPETNLHGIELDAVRLKAAKELLPLADLRVGDATKLPWDDGAFRLVIASTVFTSVLDPTVRRMLAQEIFRVLPAGGALLWYDFAVNNPGNSNVRKVDRRELKNLFPQSSGIIKSITLAPPLARFIAPRSWAFANLLEAIPFLRTHLIGVLIKNS